MPPVEKVTRKMDECVLSVNCLGLLGQIPFRARTKQASCSVCVNLCMCDGMFCVFTWPHVVLCVPCVCLTSGGVKKEARTDKSGIVNYNPHPESSVAVIDLTYHSYHGKYK